MKVRVLFFAALRDRAAADETWTELPEQATAADLWSALRGELGLGDADWMPAVAINEEYRAAATPLADGDVIAFLPPVAGG